MKLNVTQGIVGFDGEQLKERKGADEELRPLTLRSVCTGALMGQSKENPDGAEKLRRFSLARKIHDEDEPSVEVEDVALLKRLVGELFLANVAGAAWILLEGED